MVNISTYINNSDKMYKDIKLTKNKKTIWFKSVYVNGIEKNNTKYFLTEILEPDSLFKKCKYKSI